MRIQSPDGRFGEPHDPANNPYLMYHQGIATLALAEAYAMTQDAKLSAPVRRAVAFIQAAQQRSGGWDYSNRPTGRSDTSVTGWQLMALKSAHAAGLEVDWRTLLGVLRHIDAMTNPSGDVHYADRARYASRRGPGMMAVGMLCHQMLGWPRNSPILRQQAIRLLRNLPDWVTARSREPYSHLHTMYYWYHGTLAMFNVGGPAWAAWNAHTRDLLVAQQHLEGRRRGSWTPPSGGFDSVGGRVYATAICALTLEIYYRYLPFHTTRGFDALDVLQRAARVQGSPERRVAIRVLGQLNDERARAILVEALDDPSRAIRSIARAALVAQRSDKVLPVLLKDLAAADPTTRLHAISALDKLAFPSLIPLLVKALRDPDKTVRRRAIIALRRSTHQGFGYRHDALPAERELAVVKWEQWWRACRAAPPPEGIRGTVLVVDAEMPDAPVLSVGLEDGVRRGLRFEVRRGERTVAIVEADHVAAGITIGRVVEARAEPIRVDDEVRSIAEPASPPAKQ